MWSRVRSQRWEALNILPICIHAVTWDWAVEVTSNIHQSEHEQWKMGTEQSLFGSSALFLQAIEWLGLERTLKTSYFQHPYHGQGHIPLKQAVQTLFEGSKDVLVDKERRQHPFQCIATEPHPPQPQRRKQTASQALLVCYNYNTNNFFRAC